MTKTIKVAKHRVELESSLKALGKDSLGVVHLSFLMESIGGLTKKTPLCINKDLFAQSVVEQLLQRKVGSALLIDENERVVGIFTERDYLRHFASGEKNARDSKFVKFQQWIQLRCLQIQA